MRNSAMPAAVWCFHNMHYLIGCMLSIPWRNLEKTCLFCTDCTKHLSLVWKWPWPLVKLQLIASRQCLFIFIIIYLFTAKYTLASHFKQYFGVINYIYSYIYLFILYTSHCILVRVTVVQAPVLRPSNLLAPFLGGRKPENSEGTRIYFCF